jgi:hypothetical protein
MDAVILVAMAKKDKDDDTWRPFVQGSLSTVLPYHVDCCAYLGIVPNENGELVRRLFIGPLTGYVTGERLGGRLGDYVDNPNVVEMLSKLRGEENKNTNTNKNKKVEG